MFEGFQESENDGTAVSGVQTEKTDSGLNPNTLMKEGSSSDWRFQSSASRAEVPELSLGNWGSPDSDSWYLPDSLETYFEKSNSSENNPLASKEAIDLSPRETKAAAEKIEGRFETEATEEAVRVSLDKNLPLIVQIGLSTCPHCQNMESKVWPKLETGSSLSEKAVVLHLDYLEAEKLSGKAAELASKIKQGVDAFPSFKIFNAGLNGEALAKEQGELSLDELLKFMHGSGIEVKKY